MGKRKQTTGIFCTRPRRPRIRSRTEQLDGSHVDGYIEMPVHDQSETTDPSDSTPLLVLPPDHPQDEHAASDPKKTSRSWQQYKERELAKWAEIRDQLLDTATELAGPCFSCSFCGMEDSCPIKCDDCGPNVTYCTDCCVLVRHHLSPAHSPEQWHEDHYEPFRLGNLESTILERQEHQDCPSRTLKTFKVFNSVGRVCYWRIFVCDHEADACTLLRFGLWSATADQPQTAFSTKLLEWMTALTLECQVSVKGFCNAVRWRSGLAKYEVDMLYRALIGQSVAEFHHHFFQKRTLLHLSPELDDGTVCPACPKEDGEIIVSLDANFGLVRKRSSGTSSAGPLHQSRYFLPDADVVEFMKPYSEDSKTDEDQDCNNFQAGSSLRSRSRQEKLDVTGVFGAVCRHSMPIKFLDMHHGERLGYPVYMIQQLLSAVQPGKNLKMHIMYDIACVLTSHLNNAGRGDLLDTIQLAIPIFHCYGHKSSCQVLYSPRRIEGFGLTDGECVERLWSYLRDFSFITKEMTPSHRIDLLTDGLLHYGRRKVADMYVSIDEHYDKADKTYQLASEELKTILEQAPVSVEDVKTWRQREIDLIAQRNQERQRSTVSQWKKTYVLQLYAFYSIWGEIQSCTDGILRSALVDQHKELEQKLAQTETDHNITRFEQHHDNFKATLLLVDQEERTSLIEKLWREASERTFLLSLKKKYPDGQAIAKKLGRQLKSINKKLKKTITKYNNINMPPQDTRFPREIDFADACHPTWQCYTQLDLLEEGPLPRSMQRQAIDALCLKERAVEELRMTSKDMRQIIETGLREHEIIEETLKAYRTVGNVGAVAMLVEKRDALETYLYFAHRLFSTKLADLPDVPSKDSTDLNLGSDHEYLLDSESEDEDDEDDEDEGIDVDRNDDVNTHVQQISY